jgi:cysteinyl-tRNA synthetase
MTLHLFDTYTRTLREFQPLDPPNVRFYSCGPTVYDYAHIGNLRTYVFNDILRRVLEFNNFRVTHVMNITDVGHLTDDADSGEDKMEKGARRTGKSAWDIAEFYTQAFRADLQRLNICEPTIWCRATDHIAEQIAMIKTIEEKGYAYTTSDGLYFETAKLPDYGIMARLDIEGLQAGARIDMGEKHSPTDFALWKFSPAGQQRQMEWDSPWGKGFPGWHIECSAMSAKYLGPFFDIHTGGEDHIPVHHTNEIAQTMACCGTRLANYWVHGYFLQLDGEKMSKSSGEFLRLQLLIDKGYDPLAYRFFCLSASYRAKLTFSWEGLDGAARSLDRLRTGFYELGASAGPIDEDFMDRFFTAVNDDLNMPRAVALAWDVLRSGLSSPVKKATLLEFDRVLGLRLAEWAPKEEEILAEYVELLEARQLARKEKRWTDADAIRDQIAAAGYEVIDTPQGPKLKKKK